MTPHPATGSVRVGRYALEVGLQSGSVALFERGPKNEHGAALAGTLAEEPVERPTPVDVLEDFSESANAVADRIDHAKKLFEAAAEGRLLDRDFVNGEIDSLLELLQRLDKADRYDEELRLARALHGLLLLTFRWLELVRSLRVILGASGRARDMVGQAWALHELGTLHLAAGHATTAIEHLETALALEGQVGNALDRCTTRHNLDSARRDLAQRLLWRRLLRTAAIVGVLALLAGGGAAFALIDDPLPPLPETPALAVDLRGGGTGSVTRGTTIACPDDCDETVEAGTSVTLTARAAAGSTFVGWEDVDCSEEVQNGATCTVTVDEDVTVGAVFTAPDMRRLTVDVRGGGVGSVTRGETIACPDDCEETVEAGTTVTLTARAAGRSSFKGWEDVDCAEEVQNGATCTVTVNADVTVGAVFDPRLMKTLTVDLRGEGSGSVRRGDTIACPGDCDESVAPGTSVTLTATAGEGSTFMGWEDVGCAEGAQERTTCTVKVDEDVTVAAVFEPLETVSLSVRLTGGTGTVTSDQGGLDCSAPDTCSATLVKGTDVTLTATPAQGSFVRWDGVTCADEDDDEASDPPTCTLTTTDDLDVIAFFSDVD